MTGFEQSYEGLENLILRDQYFLTCDKALQAFLKERGKLGLKDMAKAANNYYEAYGSQLIAVVTNTTGPRCMHMTMNDEITMHVK